MKGERKNDQDWLSISFLSCSLGRDALKAATILTCVPKLLRVINGYYSKFNKFKDINGSWSKIATTTSEQF